MGDQFDFDRLRRDVAAGDIDTVLVCAVDMQGRLIGKRFLARFFVESGFRETHVCNYLLANDIDMEPVEGFKVANWSLGYGDMVMKPDLRTLRRLPWLPKTAMVMSDLQDHDGEDLPHSPRAILKKQVARLAQRGYRPFFASELEFYLFEDSYDRARAGNWRDLRTASPYSGDYLIGITSKEEAVMRRLRNEMAGAGIPIECSQGEWSAGQQEINVRYGDALETADHHAVLKNGAREIASSEGKAITFMAKVRYDLSGNSSHIHNSLWDMDGNTPLFHDPQGPYGLTRLGQQWAAGQLKYARDYTLLLAPGINSYKRFQAGTFAPTTITWSEDNRTAGFRLCGQGTKGVRTECRIGGADLNPYLAFAALIAAGLAGIDEDLDLPPPFRGDAYAVESLPEIPKTLREAIEAARASRMLYDAFGEDVMEHYLHAARWEQVEYDRRVTDWELHRGFERA